MINNRSKDFIISIEGKKDNMEIKGSCPFSKKKFSRRKFLKSVGAATTGFVLNPFIKSEKLSAHIIHKELINSAQAPLKFSQALLKIITGV